jgi:hypothetical protein
MAPKFLRPTASIATVVLRLHTEACRLARNKPDAIAHPEVARALEQDLIVSLIKSLTAREFRRHSAARQRHAEIMARFEDVLAAQDQRQLPLAELSAAVGVKERRLQWCCRDFLHKSPLEYAVLRRRI